ncbi:hypothetical protein MCEL_42790 [Mycolicibacterium celeriflavum]|uniref:Uncharacterized protein n=1 Tax=Mycolicibacterium celeriflavum TaxID=1249101 RepID=A0A7I7RN15_MYCCF|nr:hypothetical protein MCEL_42790 [Mycolicibacterium celeriflavum]
MVGDRGRQLPGQHRVDLDGGHPRTAVEQGQRQRAQAGTDLEDMVVPVDPGRRDDPPYRVRVVDEVLTESFTRPEIDLFGQLPYLSPPE